MGVATKKIFSEVQKKDIFDKELVPLFFISKYLGLFNYTKGRKISLSHSLAGFVFHLLLGCIAASCLYGITSIMDAKDSSFTVQIVTYGLAHGINVLLALIHVLVMIWKKSAFQELIDMLLIIDVLWPKHSIFYSRTSTKLGMACILVFYYTAPVILGARTQWLPLFVSGLCVTELCFFYIVMQFCSILDITKVHLNELRDGLVNNEALLVDSVGRHQTLLRFCPVVNECFSWQLLIMCMKFFIFNLMVAYTVILDNAQLVPTVLRIIIVLYQLGLIFAIARCCSEIEEEADSFNNKLFNLMRESKDLCSNDKLHLYVTMKQSVSFTACGFFTLGYPLVTSIIAAATTYLVILVQFSMSPS